jgi:cytochrome c oxidase subunit 2
LVWRALLAVSLAAAGLILWAGPVSAATGLNPLLPNAVSPNGQDLYRLYNLISIPALVVFFLVEILLLTVIIRDRRSRRGPDYKPPQVHGNTKFEIAWTIAPFLVLVLIGTLSFQTLYNDFRIENNVIAPGQGPSDLEITVVARQFGYTFTYPEGFQVTTTGTDAADNPLVVPTGKLVRMRLDSTDVIHGLWVPDVMGKTDLVPGYSNYTWFRIAEPGEWRGQCTELCGAGHSTMLLRIRAMTPADYAIWAAEMKSKAATPTPSPSPGS